MLYNTDLNQQKNQNTKFDNTNSNKKVIMLILLLAIIISGSILGFLVARQNNETEQQANVPIDTPMPVGTRPGDVPVPDIIITQEQLLINSDMNSCWTVVDEVVYDITESIQRGSRFLGDMSEVCGKDGTKTLQGGLEGRPQFEEIGIFELYSRPMGRISP